MIKNNEYFGIVDNMPEFTEDIKTGDTIKINKDNISDWMYVNNKKLYGGFTLILLRKRMSESERKAFDLETELIFDE
jgi:uncharacterized protein YegJ (DUF2314 family)